MSFHNDFTTDNLYNVCCIVFLLPLHYSRLETSSRQYGVPLLASHFFHELLSDSVQQRCRKVDVVTVKGSEVPIGVYTYDCFQDQVRLVNGYMYVDRAAAAAWIFCCFVRLIFHVSFFFIFYQNFVHLSYLFLLRCFQWIRRRV